MENTKECKKCGRTLPIDMFWKKDKNRRMNKCKECAKTDEHEKYMKRKDKLKEYQKEYQRKNRDKINESKRNKRAEKRPPRIALTESEKKEKLREQRKKYYDTHREQRLAAAKAYRERNREELREKAREYEKTRIITGERKEKKKQRHKERIETDCVYKLKHTARKTIRDSFKRKGFEKNSEVNKIVGCNSEELAKHLTETYLKNYGIEYDGTQEVHIDHIIPLALAKTEEDVIRLCHWSNLQLLNAEDNLKKSNKLDYAV